MKDFISGFEPGDSLNMSMPLCMIRNQSISVYCLVWH